jgi:2-(1,2-epoxy-1,2-dihydrophenyl)acetyl-CoA isomerase
MGGRNNDVLTVTLNRPEKLNALDAATLRALRSAWRRAAEADVRAVVITGAGRGFCAGADLTGGPSAGADLPEGYDGLRDGYNPHILALFLLDVPVVAAINGAVAGAGLAIAFAADIRIASERAKFAPAFARIGLVPDSGATFLIPRVLGPSRAFEWLSSARTLDAAESLEWQISHEVVPADTVLARAQALADELAAMPGIGVSLTKRALNTAQRRAFLEHLELEAELQRMAVSAEGRAEARSRVVTQIRTDQRDEETQ